MFTKKGEFMACQEATMAAVLCLSGSVVPYRNTHNHNHTHARTRTNRCKFDTKFAEIYVTSVGSAQNICSHAAQRVYGYVWMSVCVWVYVCTCLLNGACTARKCSSSCVALLEVPLSASLAIFSQHRKIQLKDF